MTGITDTQSQEGIETASGAARIVHSITSRVRIVGPLIPFALLFVALSIASGPFFTSVNLLNILDQQSSILIIAVAGTLVLISGGIDLSVGAIYGLASVVSAEIALSQPPAVAVLVGVLVGLLAGLVNGVVATLLRINPLIATLAMSFVLAGAANLVTKGNLVVLSGKPDFGALALTDFLGVRTSIWIMLIVVIIVGVLLSRTSVGRYFYAVGGNREAARLSGIRVNGIRILAFVLSGGAAALGGIIDTSRVLSAQATSEQTLTFTVLAGIVV
ncbi:MAG: ABC transporter permease, partial [Actinomycetota bacterium]|nr:ABC transporter permease [Actinomycetota bacterium]